jgi:hypothetical protein
MEPSTSAQDRLRFAVHLAQVDLDHLRPGDLLTLRGELENFFFDRSGSTPVLLPTAGMGADGMGGIDFGALQSDVRLLLNGLVDSRVDTAYRLNTIPVAFNLAPLRSASGVNASLVAQGAVRDTFLLMLWHLMATESSDAIQRCAAPDCTNLFYRVRKQQFCGPRCTNRAYMRQYRADPKVRAKEADANHDRYGRRLKQNGVAGQPKRQPRTKRNAKERSR